MRATVMSESIHCPKCGTALPEGAEGTDCPNCLLDLGLPHAEAFASAANSLAQPKQAVPPAGISPPQSAFAGSDRQGRGRLVDALRQGRVGARALAEVMGWPDADRAERVAATLVADGLAVRGPDGSYRLP